MTSALVYGRNRLEGDVKKLIIEDADCALAYCGLEELEAEITVQDNWCIFSVKDLELYSVCIGGVQSCRTALFKLGLRDFDVPCYPEGLKIFMGRAVELTTLGKVVSGIRDPKRYLNKFVKPVAPKRFKAFLTHNEEDYAGLFNLEYDEKVYAADIVEFSTEWRVYVKRNEIIRICNYAGKPTVFPNTNVIRTMIDAWKGPCCYALDVGVVQGQTLLVEVNDFYSIGNYGLFPTEYAEMLLLRWKELTGKP